MIIKNADSLSHSKLRRDAVSIAEAGLAAIDTDQVLRQRLVLSGDTLTVDGTVFDLSTFRHTYIVGFGKVTCKAARTLETLLASRVRAGAVIGISDGSCEIVDTYTGTHPLPSHQNYTATKHIESIARQATEDDLVIVIVGGGGSALLCSSIGECEQGAALYHAFLPTGGTIEELNTVRKHISRLKGGGLAAALYPATVIGLIFSDVPGDEMSAVASGPTYRDETTIDDAHAIITKYGLGSFHLLETPKDEKYFTRVHNFPMVSNVQALQAMCATAREFGYTSTMLGANAYHTPSETIALLQEQAEPYSFYCIGGETKVTVPEGCVGKGGRNDYLALTALEALPPETVFVSLATDGHDNSDAAGALCDDLTRRKALEQHVKREEYLECHNSYPFFDSVGDHIVTGKLESNVSDLIFWLRGGSPALQERDERITHISAEIVPDSRGTPTIAVTVHAGHHTGTFSVPSGASTGSREVVALPANEARERVLKTIAPALIGLSVIDQEAIDARLHEIDGSNSFVRIGGNAALGVSVASLKAAAALQEKELWQYIKERFSEAPQAAAPRLFANLINGGAHAPFGPLIQEHQIIPDTDSVGDAFTLIEEVERRLHALIEANFDAKDRSIGDEGGAAIRTTDPLAAFSLLREAIAALAPEYPVHLGADIAASSFYDQATATYRFNDARLTANELLARYSSLHTAFPELSYVEDPFDERALNDFARYQAAQPVTVIGDDATTTNLKLLEAALRQRAISGIIIKPNQIGTVTDTLATMRRAYRSGVRCIVSHRSGETMDDFIADLAFGTKAYGLKAGAPSQPERRVKYERLLQIANSV